MSKEDKQKMLVYLGTDDLILYYSNLFNHLFFHPIYLQYIPFASVIMLELHKFSDGKYYVNVSINAEAVALSGACKNQYYCELSMFEEMARDYSYYDN